MRRTGDRRMSEFYVDVNVGECDALSWRKCKTREVRREKTLAFTTSWTQLTDAKNRSDVGGRVGF